MSETKSLCFSIEGEFLTNVAREKLYYDKDLESAVNILRGGLCSDQITPNEQLMICLQILNGDAAIKGNSNTDEYGLYYEDDIDKNNCDMSKIFDLIKTLNDQVTQLKEECKNMQSKFLFLCNDMTEYRLEQYNADYYNEYGEPMFEDMKIPGWRKIENQYLTKCTFPNQPSSMLESFLEQRHRENDEDIDTSEDYGWLEPNGTYHPVDWGCHADWAEKYLNEHNRSYKNEPDLYQQLDDNNKLKHLYNAGDVLVFKLGWVLIDSPGQGLGYPTCDPTKGFTNAQREFLFDYYTKRNRSKEANALYQNENS